MRSLFISQELAPWFVEGGLGLTAATLPGAVHDVAGVEFTIVLPYYPWLVEQAALETDVVATFPSLKIGQREEAATLYRVRKVGEPHEILLIRSDAWYQRGGGIYRDHDYVEYRDAVPRAAFFGWCVRQLVAANPGRYSHIHANDWQSGLALFLCADMRREARVDRPALIYQIHAGEVEQRILPEVLPTLGLDDSQLEFITAIGADQPSMMLLGLQAADILVTCSPTYAVELQATLAQTPMAEPLRRRGITGIVTGIDTSIWNPARSDTSLIPYTAANVRSGKQTNKLRLQVWCGFAEDAECPIFAVNSRLVPEKGIDLVLQVFAELLRRTKLQLVVMGVGDRPYTEALQRLEAAYPAHVRYFPAFDPGVAQLLYAGSDFTLMPSIFEPCGLNQLIAMRYGTIPIVSAVGGLKDTVTDLHQDPERGVGFVLGAVSTEALETRVVQAMAWLQSGPDFVDEVRRRMMGQDWSWSRAAVAYTTLYERALQVADASARMERDYGLVRAPGG